MAPQTTLTAKLKRKVHTKTTVADDLELHVSTIRVAGTSLLEVRNYIPSLKQYGRGITVPATEDVFNAVRNGLNKAESDGQRQ